VPFQTSLARLLLVEGELDAVAAHREDRVRRLAQRVVDAKVVVPPVAVGRQDRVERMADRDHRRLRVERDRARQHEGSVRELHDRKVDTVRLDDPVVGDTVPDQVEIRPRFEGAVRE